MTAKVIQTLDELNGVVNDLKNGQKRIGVVPTMGALHAGHVSLASKSIELADSTIATIFVNPAQFAPGEDLDQYPRTLERDIEHLGNIGVDFVFAPDNDVIYPDGFSTFIEPPAVAKKLEGEHRPAHFRGVTTVVLKLLNMTQADMACFGQKDYQQCLVVQHMVRDLNIPCEIVICPIIRDDDGMALSSRNRYLSDEEREKGLSLSRTLTLAESLISEGETDTHVLMNEMKQSLIDGGVDSIDYAMVADADDLSIPDEVKRRVVCLVAAHVGSTRLIDNCVVEP